jgi:2-haloacid dehalogenase
MSPQTSLIVFDVNETLSDMSPLGRRFADVGAEPQLAAAWFAGLLRDGFALTVTGAHPAFGDLAQESLRVALSTAVPAGELDDAARHVFKGIAELEVHADVVPGIRAIAETGLRMVTLSVGAAEVADRLLERAGIRDAFEATLSVAEAGRWKPDEAAYRYALDRCGVPAGEALLVAVHPWDLEGAHHAGLRTAWIDRAGSRFPAYFAQPDVVVESVGGLVDHL